MRRALVAVVLLGLICPAGAGALTYREQRALSVAKAKWKRLPCGGRVVIVRAEVPVPLTAVAEPPCRIVVRPEPALIWSMFCTIVVHEVGHLLGIGHSPDPLSVMYPRPLGYWRCAPSAGT